MSASRAEERAAATSITISPSIGEELGRHWQRERMVEYLQRRDGFALERYLLRRPRRRRLCFTEGGLWGRDAK